MAERIVIIGSGIVGLAHALEAREAGHQVTVVERTGRPLGASVRNFGTLWPIGQEPGERRERALRSVKRWRDVAPEAGIWTNPVGSLHLAYHDDAWAVLREFVDGLEHAEDLELLSPEEVVRRSPGTRPEGLRGGLFSATEVGVQPEQAVGALIRWLDEEAGVRFRFACPAVRVHDDSVEVAGGERLPFDRAVVCSGDELRLLFPEALRRAGLRRTRLHMMRTRPQPEGWHLGPILCSELTLRHYPSFAHCPSLPALKARVSRQSPACDTYGIHVLAAQHPDGDLVIGDSHEYADDFPPAYRTDVESLILRELDRFLEVPDPTLAERWVGTYVKAQEGQTEVVLEPRPRVRVVTGLGGAGMTLAFAVARESF